MDASLAADSVATVTQIALAMLVFAWSLPGVHASGCAWLGWLWLELP